MENGKFFIIGNSDSNCIGSHFIWIESTCWNLCTLNGSWSNFWKNGWNSRQGFISVRFISFPDLSKLIDLGRRAHPDWSMFSACDPNKPCITPGTYAFLGAAAGLAYV